MPKVKRSTSSVANASEQTTSFFENLHGLLGRDLTLLQLRIEERARGAQQPQLERDQLAVVGHVRQHEPLRVQTPAFDVGAVEGEHGARQRHAALHHGVELQLVAGPGFMRDQRPGRGRECEVVVLERLAALAGGAHGKHELAALAVIVDHARRAACAERAAARFRPRWRW